MPTKLGKNVVAVDEDFDESQILGRLVTYTMPDEGRNGAQVVAAWHARGLDINDLPDARQPVHIFQSACRSVETRRRENGATIEIKVDEVLNSQSECVYQVTRMVRDRVERLIDHPKAMRITFTKDTSEIAVDELEDFDALAATERQIREHFEANAENLVGQKIRNAVRDVCLSLGAQNLRRKAGGLYFVPKEFRKGKAMAPTLPVLDALQGFLSDIYGDRADFYVIPLANREAQRDMVRKHFVINVLERAHALEEKALNKVREVQSGKNKRKVRDELIANLYNERRLLLHDFSQFQQLVGGEMGDIETTMRELAQALDQLTDVANGEAVTA